jgi:HK97 family phage major capsid protein
MDVKDLQGLKDELKGASAKVQELVTKQAEELKAYGQTTAATGDKLAKAEERIDALMSEKSAIEERLSQIEVKANRPGFGEPAREIKATPGMQFVMSEEYKSANKNGATSNVDVTSMFERKQLVGDTGDRAPVWSEQVPELFYDPGQRQMTLRDIMNVGQTSSNNIEFFSETTFDENNAKSQDGEGSAKAQQAMQFEKKSAPVETIAAWLPVSRQVLDDAAMLQSHIDNRLTYAVLKEMENQILFGTGSSGELLGISNTPGVETIGAPSGGATAIDHVRAAIAQVRTSEYAATGVVIHPSDWADIELTKGSDNHYIWVSVPDGGVPRLWRVPVVETTAMQEGRFLVGAFGLGAQLWDRMNATIRISDSHSTYFTQNLIAVLAEIRVALTTYRPRAFVRGLFDDTLST